MKKGAMVENDIITNVVNFEDDILAEGYLDITSTPNASIGHPIVDGVPVLPPTGSHILSGLTWIITPENQTRLDEQAIERSRIDKLFVEKETFGLNKTTSTQRKTFIDDTFNNATTVAQLRAAMKTFAEKILPYVLS